MLLEQTSGWNSPLLGGPVRVVAQEGRPHLGCRAPPLHRGKDGAQGRELGIVQGSSLVRIEAVVVVLFESVQEVRLEGWRSHAVPLGVFLGKYVGVGGADLGDEGEDLAPPVPFAKREHGGAAEADPAYGWAPRAEHMVQLVTVPDVEVLKDGGERGLAHERLGRDLDVAACCELADRLG